MGLILWIDSNIFASTLIEKVFKKRNLPFYRLNQVKDFSYLIEDLKPGLIVLDPEIAIQNLDLFKAQYASSAVMQETPFVVLGTWEGLEFIQRKKGNLGRTLDPFRVPESLADLP